MSANESQKYQDDNIVYGTDPANVLPRLEIDEFVVDDKDTLNLFLIALSVLQKPNVKPAWVAEKTETPSYAKFRTNDQWTFQKLAAVHGWPPKTPWCDVGTEVAKKALQAADKDALVMDNFDDFRGYCCHASNIFPSWHRPYMAAYEQMIYNKMHDIANAYTTDGGKEKYIKAARKFRFPYWDPVMPRNRYDPEADPKQWFGQFCVPTIITSVKVYVWTPEDPDKSTEILNPLYSFLFTDGKPAPLDVSETNEPDNIYPPDTLRNATLVEFNGDRHSDVNLLNKTIQGQISVMARGMHRLFAVERSWSNFSNHARNRRGGTDSTNPMLTVESWHDNIHNAVGGVGHLGDPQIAAYDPIFWLHHCNIDRLVSIYQTQQPQTWVDESAQFEQTLVYGRGLRVDAKTPLLPFYKAKDQFWTSDDAADWEKMGYTYKNTHYSAQKTKDPAQKKAIEEYINSKYTWITEYREPPNNLGFPIDLKGVEALPPGARKGESKSLIDRTKPNKPDEVYPPGTEREDGTILTWDAGIRVPKFLLQRSYNIWIFIGKPDERWVTDNPQWPAGYPKWLEGRDWKMAGFSGVFVNSGVQDGSCENCRKQEAAEVIYEDVLPMLMPLRRYLKSYDGDEDNGPPRELRTLETLEPKEVTSFLKEHLHVRLDNLRGQEVPFNEDIKNALTIQITSQSYIPRTPEHPLGQYGEPTVHDGIGYKTSNVEAQG